MYNAYKVSKNERKSKQAVNIIYIEFQFKQEVLARITRILSFTTYLVFGQSHTDSKVIS
jgi:hypothetical protein